jgi:dipeptidyl-peptidase-4
VLQGAEENLSPEEKARRERMRVTARGFASFQLSEDGTLVLVSLSGKLFTFHRGSGKIQELPTGKGTLLDPKFSPDGKQIGYVLDHDVYVMDLATLKERRVTTGGTEDVSHGLAEFVAQEEMDRHTGWWWSPDSQSIAFEEADNREVEIWEVADPAKPGQIGQPQRYPRPGKNNTKVRLGVVSARGGEPVWVKWDAEKYPYLATVKWDKGGPLTILIQARSQQEMVLLAVDASTGSTTPLLTEKDDAWLNLDQDVPRWLKDGSGFLWSSEREGAPQLELRDPKGGLVRVVIPSDAGYLPSFAMRGPGLLHVDEQRKLVYFRGTENPTQSHLFRASLHGGRPERLTEESGIHSAVFSQDGSVSVRSFSGPKTLRRSYVMRQFGSNLIEVPSVAEEPPFQPTTEIVKVGEGKGFWCSVTRPRAFNPKQKYPVIVDVYAGPGIQRVANSKGSHLMPQWLADQGFIVVSMDGRGTPGRGREWERCIRSNFGVIPLEDQSTALHALAQKYRELDLSRVGITGWSFGGYMSALAVLKRPDIFKAGVAGAPVTDWQDYDTHYTERYLGLPNENTSGYHESSLLTYAKDLKRPLLIIHGTCDDNVYFVHSLKLSEALFRAGKEHQVLPLSGFTHMVPDPLVRERLEERIVRFFQKHLKGS